MTFHPRDDETGAPSYYAVPMTSGDEYLHLGKPITHSSETCASVIQYLMDCGAPIDNTYDDNFDSVGTIEANWVPTSKAIKGCYNQLISLMASYNTQMYDALDAEIPCIAVAVGSHFGKNELNEFADIVMLRIIMDKFEGDSKAVRDDLVTKLKQATDMKITDRRAVDVFNYMHSVHELVIELLRLKVSPELIEDYATVPVPAVLENAQDRNDVMGQLQWRAIGKVAAKFFKM